MNLTFTISVLNYFMKYQKYKDDRKESFGSVFNDLTDEPITLD